MVELKQNEAKKVILYGIKPAKIFFHWIPIRHWKQVFNLQNV